MRNTVRKSPPDTVPRRARQINTAVNANVTRLFTVKRAVSRP